MRKLDNDKNAVAEDQTWRHLLKPETMGTVYLHIVFYLVAEPTLWMYCVRCTLI